MDKVCFELGKTPSPVCKKGRHDRCAAYDNMVIHCTCACHGKLTLPDALPDAWLDLRATDDVAQRVRASVEAELQRELLPAHPLHGVEVAAVAKCGHCDDALFLLGAESFAIVHLTWAMHRETPPLPRTDSYPNAATALAVMREHAADD